MAYILPYEQQLTIIHLLLEGGSISGVGRITGNHRRTILDLMVRFGTGCWRFLDREMRDLELGHLEVDEMWTYVQKKGRVKSEDDEPKDQPIDKSPEAKVTGRFWLYIGLDEKTRLIPVHRVGKKTRETTHAFMQDLESRLRRQQVLPHESDDHAFKKGAYRPMVRISTDGYPAYRDAVVETFEQYVAFGQIIKNVSKGEDGKKKVDVEPTVIAGDFDKKAITTSLVERSNLTTRTLVRRFMRRTLGFSKKLENLQAAVAMHIAYYNYCWKPKTIKKTPAVAAGIAESRLSVADLYAEVRKSWPELFFGG